MSSPTDQILAGVSKCGSRFETNFVYSSLDQFEDIQFYLGTFDTEEGAAKAYERKAIELCSEISNCRRKVVLEENKPVSEELDENSSQVRVLWENLCRVSQQIQQLGGDQMGILKISNKARPSVHKVIATLEAVKRQIEDSLTKTVSRALMLESKNLPSTGVDTEDEGVQSAVNQELDQTLPLKKKRRFFGRRMHAHSAH